MALVDDVLRVITTYLGLQGDAGARLQDLWSHLAQEGPFAGLPDLPARVKHAAWQALRNDADAFVFFCPEKVADITGQAAAFVDGASQGAIVFKPFTQRPFPAPRQ